MRCAAHVLLAASAVTALATGEWYPCPLLSSVSKKPRRLASSNQTAECMDVVAPVCYPGVCEGNETLGLFVKRLPARTPVTPAKAVWLLQGGPGAASQDMESMMADVFEAANGTISVYTMDHRGTGRSSRLQALCPKYTATMNYTLESSRTTLSDCFANITAKYGPAAAKGFSTTSAASDLAALIRSTLLATSDVYVYATARTLERLMHMSPSNVKGYILDSIVGESPISDWLNWDIDMQPVESSYYALCDKDPVCASKIGPNAQKFATTLFAKLDRRDTACARALARADVGRPSDVLASTFANLIQSHSQRNMIPAILFRMKQCVEHYDAAAKTLVKALVRDDDEESLRTGNDVLATSVDDDLLYHNIVFNDLYAPVLQDPEVVANKSALQTWRSATVASIQQDLIQVCVYRGNRDPRCASLPKQKNSFYYAHDAYWNKTAAVPKGASVLMLSGALDTQTPPAYAVAEHAGMAGTNKLLLQFPLGGHSIVDTTPTKNTDRICGLDVFNSYLQVNGVLSKVDTRCMQRAAPLDFETILSSEKAMALFGTDTDMFGDSTSAVVRSQSDNAADDKSDLAVHAAVGGLAGCVLALIGIAIYTKAKRAETTIVEARPSESVVAVVGNVVEPSKADAVADV
ncbi:serine protease family S33 [Achlya hypogyna]|uniref:Serine protease family S33 n=1 Tax=Achlya hypogyna TaxID=1202772 RepID=A0A1V9YRM2_ACHHY|nr:serine protease family S33 [Achlya hypogyna]